MTTQRSIVNLSNFFIYNPNIKCKEGEEQKKIMFYHPSNIPVDMQTRHIGLCMGVIMFTETFDPDKPCHSMHTQKTRQLYLHPEEDFWVILTVTIPFTEKTKDGKTYHEYHEDDVQDSVYLAVLKHAYQLFKVDLADIYRITSVATQGRPEASQWVTSYKLACSTDGKTFHTVQDISTNPAYD
eukprot:XP_011669465.1 PREDICTED: vacuolar fusion protein CCZ1 homolog [Strongylocentrotus purpuratus]